jgi:hypothetical protein
LDTLQLGRVVGGLGNDVEPVIIPIPPRLLPLVRREANGPGLGAGIDLNIADTGKVVSFIVGGANVKAVIFARYVFGETAVCPAAALLTTTGSSIHGRTDS